jgi:hypothetical protein
MLPLGQEHVQNNMLNKYVLVEQDVLTWYMTSCLKLQAEDQAYP